MICLHSVRFPPPLERNAASRAIEFTEEMGIDEFLRPLLPWLGGGTASIVSMPHLIAVEIRLEFAEIIRGKPVVLRLLIGRGAERHGCRGPGGGIC